MSELIDLQTLSMLQAAGAVAAYRLVVTPEGTVLEVKIGTEIKKLATTRGGLRLFQKIDTAAGMLVQLGVHLADLDLQQWEPPQRVVP